MFAEDEEAGIGVITLTKALLIEDDESCVVVADSKSIIDDWEADCSIIAVEVSTKLEISSMEG